MLYTALHLLSFYAWLAPFLLQPCTCPAPDLGPACVWPALGLRGHPCYSPAPTPILRLAYARLAPDVRLTCAIPITALRLLPFCAWPAPLLRPI
ncbi:hypothetical protein MTO96_044157 [Rhipicephalus appendiculatus]